ncbi:MAG: fumarate hydratase, partial [Ignavibacteriae bacterium]
MKKINVKEITPVIRKLFIDANYYIEQDLVDKMNEFLEIEKSETA